MALLDFECTWQYFLALEDDLVHTTRYVEPAQRDVYSLEYAKIILLAGSEIETVLRQLCALLTDYTSKAGNISKYKEEILTHLPKIVEAKVYIRRTRKSFQPFESWDSNNLNAWNAYNQIKHARNINYKEATYATAEQMLAILYILILYLAHILNIQSHTLVTKYITSEYAGNGLVPREDQPLPDFINRH